MKRKTDRTPKRSAEPLKRDGGKRPAPEKTKARDQGKDRLRSNEPPKAKAFAEPAPRLREPLPAKADSRQAANEKRPLPRPLERRSGERPAETVPLILETPGESGFRLIDSGDGEKLERYGDVTMIRPEAQALWPRLLPEGDWQKADAIFTGDTDEEGMGRWRFPGRPLGETWPMHLLGIDFWGRFTSFRHVGVFPEQMAHWADMKARIEAANRPVRVLNLFGYTGVASLVAAAAGAEVTHVDASKKAIGWARENQTMARLENKPIRWICEDAMKFILREERRGSTYDIILTDPPRFGRGPNGEVWELFDHVALMLDICRNLLSDRALALVLTAYSIRASFYSMHELMMETMRGAGGRVESGELVIRETGRDGTSPARALSTSLFSRWVPK